MSDRIPSPKKKVLKDSSELENNTKYKEKS